MTDTINYTLVHLYRRYFPDEGGIETAMRHICEEVAKTSKVWVLSTHYGVRNSIDTIAGVHVVRLAAPIAPMSTPVVPSMARWLKRLRPTIVELHHPYPWSDIAFLTSKCTCPLIVNYHNDIDRHPMAARLYAPILHRLLKRASRIIVHSEDYLAASKALAPFRYKCCVIPHGVDLEQFRFSGDVAQKANVMRTANSTPSALFVGRLSRYKGLPVLLHAMKNTGGRLIIVGRGEMETEIVQLVHSLGIADRVQMYGFVDDCTLLALYHMCDVFVLPSTGRGEAFGIVQLEAMACGKPVICSDIPGVSSVTQHDVTGLIVKTGSVGDLTAALNQLFENPDQRRAFGEAGLRRVQENYSLHHVQAQHMAVYKEVLRNAVE